MTLGEKLKKIRTDKKITQSKLCGDKITRNMLSEIECGKASPSIGTLRYLADRLDVPLAFLLSDSNTPFHYRKLERIDEIKKSFSAANYRKCISLINQLDGSDDETNFILASCYFELGKDAVLKGSLNSALKDLDTARALCDATIYDTTRIKNLYLMYSGLAKNIQSPLLEFDTKSFEKNLNESVDLELFNYLCGNYSYPFRSTIIKNHILAKELIKARRYREAITYLSEIEKLKSKENYNAHIIFTVYCDLENCYKQLGDYENAYRYSTKRHLLTEAYKS